MHPHRLNDVLWSLTYRCDEDATDRLNYHYTSCLLVFLSAIVTTRQLVGRSIECWVPAVFTHSMETYAESFCWVQSTYYLPPNSDIPNVIYERVARKFCYYQWVAFFLACQACLVYTPSIVGRIIKTRAGLGIESLVRVACQCRTLTKTQRDEIVKMICSKIRESLSFGQDAQLKARSRHLSNLSAITPGSTVIFSFFGMKLIYTLSAIVNIAILDIFIGAERIFRGYRVLTRAVKFGTLPENSNFPRVTLCDFLVRVLGNTHRHTVQCVLSVNLFNEKIFIFLWAWFCGVAAASGFSLLHWIFISASTSRRIAFVRNFLDTVDSHGTIDHASVRRFVIKFLRQDGVFLIRMTRVHAGELVAAEITRELWRIFRANRPVGVRMTVEEEIFCRERNFRIV